MKNLKVLLALGGLAHGAILTVLEKRISMFKFSHNACHKLDNVMLISSYHCSRYNTNTGRLTEQMFHDVFRNILSWL